MQHTLVYSPRLRWPAISQMVNVRLVNHWMYLTSRWSQPATLLSHGRFPPARRTPVTGEIRCHSPVRDRDPDHGRGLHRGRASDGRHRGRASDGHRDPSRDRAGNIPEPHSRRCKVAPNIRRSIRHSPNIHPPTYNRGPGTAAANSPQPAQADNTPERRFRLRSKRAAPQITSRPPTASMEAISFSLPSSPLAPLKCTPCASPQIIQNSTSARLYRGLPQPRVVVNHRLNSSRMEDS